MFNITLKSPLLFVVLITILSIISITGSTFLGKESKGAKKILWLGCFLIAVILTVYQGRDSYVAAIEKNELTQSLKSTTQEVETLKQALDYRPLVDGLAETVVKEISLCGYIKRVDIELYNTGDTAPMVEKDLIKLFNRAKVVAGHSRVGIDPGAPSGVLIVSNGETLPVAEKLAKALSKYVSPVLNTAETPLFEPGIIRITIYGHMRFNMDGTVRLSQ